MSVGKRVNGKAVCRVAAKRPFNKALQVRKEHAGSLLKTTRTIQSMQVKGAEGFGTGCHMASTEPNFYDSAYVLTKRDHALPIDEYGKCIVAREVDNDSNKHKSKKQPIKWACSDECIHKSLSETEVSAIIEFKEAFDKPIQEVRHALDVCDSDCPNQHYTTFVYYVAVDLQGHPLVCYNNCGCRSKVRILRSAATHFPVLATLLRLVSSALNAHKCVQHIDKALCDGDFQSLMEITKMNDFETVFSYDVERTYEQCTDTAKCELVQPGIETKLLTKHAQLITELEKEIDDYPEHVFCSCECLYQRQSVTRVKLSDNLSRDVWSRLKEYILDHNPAAEQQMMYMCNYCKSAIKKNKLPSRCVLNGLEIVPMPHELAELDERSVNSVCKMLPDCYPTWYIHC